MNRARTSATNRMSNRTTDAPATATGADKTVWRATQAALDVIEEEISDADCRLIAAHAVCRLLASGVLSRLQDT